MVSNVGSSTGIEQLQGDLIRFLTSAPILDAEGNLYSWVSWIDPEHVGYVYPEGMGLYLTLMSQLAASRKDAAMAECATRVAGRLQDIMHPSGGIGIHGQLYPFDVCMAIKGLLTFQGELNGHINPGVLARMAHFVVDMGDRRLTIMNEDGSLPDVAPTWSTVFGASMLKEVIALDALYLETGEERYRTMVDQFTDKVIATCYKDNSFHVIPRDSSVYTHPNCYALEGLLHLRARGYRDTTELLHAGADQLRAWQNADGGLYNWHNATPERQAARRKVGDASAQAIRIWLAVDSEAYRPQIERGLGFLASLQSPQKGLYYTDDSTDVNSITSIFAAQALEWYLHGVRADAIA